ncbi:MAG: amino acid adenylation domain-containing protein [Nannocystaceae bacterium]
MMRRTRESSTPLTDNAAPRRTASRKRRRPRLAGSTAAAIALRLAQEGLLRRDLATVTPRPAGDTAPLSSAQERLWFLHQLAPDTAAYNIPVRVWLHGPLSIRALEQAFDDLYARHQILRTTMVERDGVPEQLVGPEVKFRLRVEDLRGKRDPALEARALSELEARIPFDCAEGPLTRVRLLRTGEASYLLTLTQAHIISEAWSFSLFFTELSAAYSARCAGREPCLAPQRIQYADYAYWQRSAPGRARSARHLEYWLEQLVDLPVPLDLAIDRARPPVRSFAGGWREARITGRLRDRLDTFSRERGASLFMVCLAAFQVLLARYTHTSDIVVGCPFADRGLTELENLLGYFVSTLPLRTNVDTLANFDTLLGQVRELTLGAMQHQDLPFEELVRRLNPDRDLSQNPVFQVAMVLQNAPVGNEWRRSLSLEGMDAKVEVVSSGTAKFDLTLEVEPLDGELRIAFEYNADILDAHTVERMLDHYSYLLEQVVDHPDRPLGAFPLMRAGEAMQIAALEECRVPYPATDTVPSLVAEMAGLYPERVAAVCGTTRISYAELETRSNRLAQLLCARGARDQPYVGVCVARSVDRVVALLAVLKTGSAYLPIDPTDPEVRLSWLLRDTGTKLVLCDEASPPCFGDGGVARLVVTELEAELASVDAIAPSVDTGPDSLIYINYTSGSTGSPKGVEVCHAGVVRLVRGGLDDWLEGGTTVLHHSPLHFDASTLEIWGPLCNGGTCAIFTDPLLTPGSLERCLESHGVRLLWLTASLFNYVVQERPEALACLDVVFIGGEALSVPHVRRFLEEVSQVELVNGYGPTEVTTFTTTYPIKRPLPSDLRSIAIGRPIANTTVRVLDRAGMRVPVGVVGELCAGGPGLARGYLHPSERTEAQFIHDPYASGGRLYRTGDRVRWTVEGTLEFLGRFDDQVKIRGHRIEPGEVAAILREHPSVDDAVVIVDGTPPRLLAYVAGTVVDTAPLKDFVARRLPVFLRPSEIMGLETLPTTANGKVDKRALPRPAVAPETTADTYAAPETQLERQMAAKWGELLNVDRVGVDDDFFALGGHSLIAVRMLSWLAEESGERLPVAVLFEHVTIRKLAARVRSGDATVASNVLVPIQPGGDHRPLYCVHAIGGECMSYQALGSALAEYGRPLYGLQAPGRDDEQPPLDSVTEMAALYVRAILKHDPLGPYLVGGSSFGATVAYEMARQFDELGKRVAHVVLIDCAPLGGWQPVNLFRRLGGLALRGPEWAADRAAAHGSFLKLFAHALRRVRRKVRPSSRSRYDNIAAVRELFEGQDLPERYKRLYAAHLRGLGSHRMGRFRGDVAVVRCRASNYFGWPDADYGWSRWVDGRVTAHLVPGGHGTMLAEPHVLELARWIHTHLVHTDC